jgi:hypothetical protein
VTSDNTIDYEALYVAEHPDLLLPRNTAMNAGFRMSRIRRYGDVDKQDVDQCVYAACALADIAHGLAWAVPGAKSRDLAGSATFWRDQLHDLA